MAWRVTSHQMSWGPDQVQRNCSAGASGRFRHVRNFPKAGGSSAGVARNYRSVSLAQRASQRPLKMGSLLIPAAGVGHSLLCAGEGAGMDFKKLTFNETLSPLPSSKVTPHSSEMAGEGHVVSAAPDGGFGSF